MQLNSKQQEICKNLKLFITDVDGILTDGRLYYATNGEISQAFHVQDGHGIKSLLQANIKVAILSSRHSQAVSTRMRNLGVDLIWQGIEDKLTAYLEILENLNLKAEETCYIGDDVVDIPVLERVGLSFSVADGHPNVLKTVDLITEKPGGTGAIRQITDLILENRK